MRLRSLDHLCERAVLLLLAFAILWKGGKTLESTWLLLGVGALCVLQVIYGQRGSSREQEKEQSLPLALLLCFLLWTFVSYLLSKTMNYGLDELLQTGGLIFITLWILLRQERAPGEGSSKISFLRFSFEEQFIFLMAFIAVLSCFVGVIVYTVQPVNRFVGTFFDPRFHTDYWPNAFAEFLLLAWPMVLLATSRHFERGSLSLIRFRLKRFAYKFLPIGIVIGCLLLSYSRGALIAFIGQILLLTILLSRRHAAGSTIIAPLRRIASALCIGFVVFVSANELRSMLYPVESVTEKITFQSAEGRSSVDERLQFWKHSALLTLQQPLFGFGPYSFRFVHPQYQQHVLTTSDHPHNLFLKFSAERGIPAALLFGCFLFLVLVAGLRLSRSGKRLPESLDSVRLGSALLTTSVAGTIAHNLIDYNLQFVGIALPLFLTMGFLLRHAPSFHFVRLPASITGRRIRNTLACCSLLLLLIALREGWYLVTSSAGRHAEASGNAEAALGWYKTSSAEWFSRDLFLSEAHLLLAQGKPDEATASLNRYLTFNGSDARALKLKGEIALLEDDFESAIAAFHQAFQLAGWNDMGIARGLLEALFAESYQQPTTNAAADSRNLALNPEIALVSPEIERRARAFADAIEQNLHFVALSPNVEETVKVLIMLSVLYPEKTDEFHSLINTIEQKASEERMRTRSRPPGFLW